MLKRSVEEWNEWRKESDEKPDLREADLMEADLMEASLSGANLIRAYLRVADLSRADLSRANLGGAYLREADLSEAINITSEQIKSAINWERAIYDETLRIALGLAPDYDEEIRKELKLPPREVTE